MPSPRSSPQGATVQRALRQQLHVLQVALSTVCFDDTFFLCPHLFLMSCLVGPPTPLYHLVTRSFTVKRVPVPIVSPCSFVCSPKCFCSTQRTHALHRSILQGNIPPPRGRHHPRSVPLVSQVASSHYVIVWGGGLDVLGITGSPPPFVYSPLVSRGTTRPIGLSFSSSLLFFRTQLLLRTTFLKKAALSPRSSLQEATVQWALRQ
jgi:hypothetical protein